MTGEAVAAFLGSWGGLVTFAIAVVTFVTNSIGNYTERRAAERREWGKLTVIELLGGGDMALDRLVEEFQKRALPEARMPREAMGPRHVFRIVVSLMEAGVVQMGTSGVYGLKTRIGEEITEKAFGMQKAMADKFEMEQMITFVLNSDRPNKSINEVAGIVAHNSRFPFDDVKAKLNRDVEIGVLAADASGNLRFAYHPMPAASGG